MYEDDLDELDKGGTVDVCPSCGVLLSDEEELTEGCNDPMGCGVFLEDDDYDEEDEDDYGLEELNFD